MNMTKIQTQCPNCQQPMLADLVQIVDVRENPELKQQLLGNGVNIGQCQVCGFQGQIPVPLVYHDPDKELLLTFTPPNMGNSLEEKESVLGPLLSKVMDSLPPQDRKAYLFEPKSMLTMKNLIKNVLEGEGITEEMIEGQQKKMQLLEQLLGLDGEKLVKEIQDNEEIIDQEFFAIFSEIAQRVVATQDQEMVQRITDVQEKLLQETEIGKEIDQERREIEAARSSLENLGERLNRSTLLDLVVTAPGESRVKALASMVRPLMDYTFFQNFTELIEQTDGGQRQDLIEKRNYLLKLTQDLDKAVNERLENARKVIDDIIKADDLEQAVQKALQNIDDFFVQALSQEIQNSANEPGSERTLKLEKLMTYIEELSTPPELKLVDQLLQTAGNQQELNEKIKELREQIDSEFINYLTAIMNSYEERISETAGDEKNKLEENYQLLKNVYNAVLRYSMEMNISS
jgi:hypothetical protein